MLGAWVGGLVCRGRRRRQARAAACACAER